MIFHLALSTSLFDLSIYKFWVQISTKFRQFWHWSGIPKFDQKSCFWFPKYIDNGVRDFERSHRRLRRKIGHFDHFCHFWPFLTILAILTLLKIHALWTLDGPDYPGVPIPSNSILFDCMTRWLEDGNFENLTIFDDFWPFLTILDLLTFLDEASDCLQIISTGYPKDMTQTKIPNIRPGHFFQFWSFLIIGLFWPFVDLGLRPAHASTRYCWFWSKSDQRRQNLVILDKAVKF